MYYTELKIGQPWLKPSCNTNNFNQKEPLHATSPVKNQL